MNDIGIGNMTSTNLFDDMLLKWPVFNPHTDYTSIMSPATGQYETTVWITEEV